MIIRPISAHDKTDFLSMMDAFYHSNAVLHPIPMDCMERCFDACTSESPYLQGYIFTENSAPAGFALVSTGFSTEAGGLCIQIEDLYVLPAFRGNGFARQFFAFLQRQCPKGTRRFRLEVEPDNVHAIHLYTRLGFQDLPYAQMVLDINS